MKELTKYLKYLAISSLFFIVFSCSKTIENESVEIQKDTITVVTPMTKEDSILQLANDLNIEYNIETDNINVVLDKILKTKEVLIFKLDSLDKRANEIEFAAINYKKKENEKIKKQLLSEIDKIKVELERIKSLAGRTDEIIEKDNSIPEVVVPDIVTSFENLPSGNYVVRLDKYRILSVFVSPTGQIIVTDPIIDSTTVISGRNLDPRLVKELKQIKEKFKEE